MFETVSQQVDNSNTNTNTNYPACTIVRFINRKIVNYCLSNRNYITERNHYL